MSKNIEYRAIKAVIQQMLYMSKEQDDREKEALQSVMTSYERLYMEINLLAMAEIEKDKQESI